MKDKNGTIIHLGDSVSLPNKEAGYVVLSIDTGEFSQEFPENDWAYLGGGIMIKTRKGALIHIASNDSGGIEVLKKQ